MIEIVHMLEKMRVVRVSAAQCGVSDDNCARTGWCVHVSKPPLKGRQTFME